MIYYPLTMIVRYFAFGSVHETSAHTYAVGAKSKSGGKAVAVGYAAGSDDGS